MNNKFLVWGSVILGVALLGLALFYWTTPAESLPHYLPGYEAGRATVHFKHGLAALILACFLFVFAWFKSGPKSASAEGGAQ